MCPRPWFNVRQAVQYDMSLHGSRFIIVEFALASILAAGLLVLSIRYALRLTEWPWGYLPWLLICASILLNSIVICLLARQVEKKEGAHPTRPTQRARDIWLLPIMVVVPLVLAILAWRQRELQ